MRIYFSPKVSIIGGILVLLMLRASVWQWERHLEKQGIIKEMQQRLQLPIEDLSTFLASAPEAPAHSLTYRRFRLRGEFDFAHEMILRNRMRGQLAGVHVLTPLKLENSGMHVLVNRGFIPIENQKPDQRKQFQRPLADGFVGLAKASSAPSWYSPRDIIPSAASGQSWLDAWHRVDLDLIQTQLPYKLAPFYLELMSVIEPQQVESAVVRAESGREELLLMGVKQVSEFGAAQSASSSYPIPSFDPVIPAGRHLGYVYEWGFMALVTALICLVLQLRPPRFA